MKIIRNKMLTTRVFYLLSSQYYNSDNRNINGDMVIYFCHPEFVHIV